MDFSLWFNMSRCWVVALSLVVTVGLTGCGAPSASLNMPPAKVLQTFPSTYSDLQFYGACDTTAHPLASERTCSEWRGTDFSAIDLRSVCASLSTGVYLSQPCDTTNQIGVCKVFSLVSAQKDVLLFYHSTNWNITTAAADCEARASSSASLGSVWVPGS